MKPHVIGIDLGTINSCVAYLDDGNPRVIADESGNPTTPSLFAVGATGDPIVGFAARAQHEQNRLHTIFAVKRLIGLKFDSPEVARAKDRLPYKIIPAKNGDAWVEVDGRAISPEEISAHILLRMKQVAEHGLGEPVQRAVITVPAHFNDSQRQATRDAARIAGLDVLRVVNEPTAAALAYGLTTSSENDRRRVVGNREVDRIVAVFDLGGGTFDVSILALRNGVFEVLSTHGDTYLGGEDFDLAILTYLLEEFRKETGQDLSGDKQMIQKLKFIAREAKHQLSFETRATISLPFLTSQHHLNLVLERKTLEKMSLPILDRLKAPCLAALTDAQLLPVDVDETILVGGMTRMPAVKRFCREVFGKPPIDTINPDEAVALGAAIQAGLLDGLLRGVSLRDVTSLSLGIEVQGGMVHPIIPRNTKIPVRQEEVFTTSAPNQPQVSIHVVQGESNFAPENKTLGRFELTGIRPAPRGIPKVAVAFEVDGDGIVHVSARDEDTGEEKSIEIIASSGLSDTEIDDLLRENTAFLEQRERIQDGTAASPPSAPDEVSQALTDLRSEIFMTQFQLDVEGKDFSGAGRTALEGCLASARRVLESPKSIDEVRNSLVALRTITAVFKKFLDGSSS